MYKWIFLFIVFISLKATSPIVIYSKAIDSAIKKPVVLATTTNLSKGRTSVTDYDGWFSILSGQCTGIFLYRLQFRYVIDRGEHAGYHCYSNAHTGKFIAGSYNYSQKPLYTVSA